MNRAVELRISALLVLVGVAWLYGATLIHVELKHEILNEASFPIAIGLILTVLGSVLVVRQYRALRANPVAAAPTRDKADEANYAVSNFRPLIMALVCLAWTLLLDYVGFVIMTALAMAAILWLMEFRRPVQLALLAVATSVLLFLALDVVLRVHLPGGLLAPVTDSWRLSWRL